MVMTVTPRGPADQAGLVPIRENDEGALFVGDVIVAVDGKPVETEDELLTIIENHSIGDAVKLTLIRNIGSSREETREVTVTLAGAE
jgi:S1-C subfamily serine protease